MPFSFTIDELNNGFYILCFCCMLFVVVVAIHFIVPVNQRTSRTKMNSKCLCRIELFWLKKNMSQIVYNIYWGWKSLIIKYSQPKRNIINVLKDLTWNKYKCEILKCCTMLLLLLLYLLLLWLWLICQKFKTQNHLFYNFKY